MPAILQTPMGLQIRLYSEAGDYYETFSETNESGAVLDAGIRVIKNGGLDNFSFDLPRTKDIPINRNHVVKIYIDGINWYTGYVSDLPTPDQKNKVLQVKGLGYKHRLTNNVISFTYTSQTFAFIVDAVLTLALGADSDVYYNADKINVPTIASISMTFDDAQLVDVLTDFIELANYQYPIEYHWYVDAEQDLVIEPVPDVLRNIYEGYHFQNPDVFEDSSQIVNKLFTFRTTTLDPQVVEYTATVEDAQSQADYGVFAKKKTIPNYMNNTSIRNMAEGIIARYKDPRTRITINELPVERIVKSDKPYELISRGSGGHPVAPDMDTIDSGLVAAYDFAEGIVGETITEIQDASQNNNKSSSVSGDPAYGVETIPTLANNNFIGTYGSFDGTGDYIVVADDSSLQFGTGDFSISFFVNFGTSSQVATGYIFDKRNSGVQEGLQCYRFTDEKIYFRIPNVIGASWHDVVSNFAIDDTDWHHMVCKRLSGVMYMHVDNILQADTQANTTNVSDDVYNMFFGSDWNGVSLLDCNIAYLRIFNYGVSSDEVNELYHHPSWLRANHLTTNNLDVVRRDIVERGDCQNILPPVLNGEISAIEFKCTNERSSEDFYAGTYCRKITKTGIVGVAYTGLIDTIIDFNMHGIIPGETITVNTIIKVPTVSGIQPSEIYYVVEYYSNGAISSATVTGSLLFADTYDTWISSTWTWVVPYESTGQYILLYMDSAASLSEYFYIGRVEVIRHAVPESNSNKLLRMFKTNDETGSAEYQLNESQLSTEMQGLETGDKIALSAEVQMLSEEDVNITLYGDCDHPTIPPIILGEVAPSLQNCTAARSSTYSFISDYVWALTCTLTASFWYEMQDSPSTSDMHGVVPGEAIGLYVWIRGDTATYTGNLTSARIIIENFSGFSWKTVDSSLYAGTKDAFQFNSVYGVVSELATGIRIYPFLTLAANAGDIVYIANVVLIRGIDLATIGDTIETRLAEYTDRWIYTDDELETLDEWETLSIPDHVIDDDAIGIHFMLRMETGAFLGATSFIRNIKVQKLPYRPRVFPDVDNQNWIDRADCESTTSPMIHGETVPVIVQGTWARSSTEIHVGSYSFALTHTTGINVQTYIIDVVDTTNMHGLQKNRTYIYTVFAKTNTSDGFSGNIKLSIRSYNSVTSSWESVVVESLTKDKWIFISATMHTTNASGVSISVIGEDAFGNGGIGYFDNFRITDISMIPFNFGKYTIHNRLDNYWLLGAPCNEETDWDETGITTTVLSTDDTNTLTNREVLKLVTGSGSLDEYIEYVLPIPVVFPVAARVFLYFDTTVNVIEITFYDGTDSETISYNHYDIDLEVTDSVGPSTENMEVTDSVTPQTTDLNVGYTSTATADQWIRIETPIVTLNKVDTIRVTIKTDTSTTFYIDRIDIESSQWKHNELQLEEVRYSLSSKKLLAQATFGERKDSLIEEIDKVSKKADIPLDVVSKQ